MPRFARCFAVLACVASSCAKPAAPSAGPAPTHEGSGALLAGAAKVDITPMAGMPLGAHSVEGGRGLARWTRLWARAIYVEDERGEPLVLVSCDLWSIPAGLGDAIVERIHDHHHIDWLDRRHLLIAATHTHHGPAAFASNRFYNRAAGPVMGFDPELHEFLARRIADAIVEALYAREPARLWLERGRVGALARNRSFEPFATNPEAAALLAANADLPACSLASTQPEVCKAIDPSLTTLRIDDLEGRSIAIAAFVAVHPTTMGHDAEVYNGDLFAIASQRAEAALVDDDHSEGVVALFNGAEADVSPDWRVQGRASANALGERLGQAILATAGVGSSCAKGQAITGTIDNRRRTLSLRDQSVDDPSGQARTAKRALPGKAILGGAEDGRTRYHGRWPEGQTVARARRAGQGPKRPAIPAGLFEFAFPRSVMVERAPVSLHRLGPLAFAGLPGEFSTVMGMRIRQAIRNAALEHDPVFPILVGLADEYAGYFVTPQEYALQHYEGASTSWGQYSATFVAQAVAGLVAEDPGPAGPTRFDPGQRRDFALDASSRRTIAELDQRLAAQLGVEGPVPTFEFESAPPTWQGPTWPTITIEIHDPDAGWQPYADDRGAAFVVFPVAIGRERWRWQVWWLDSVPEAEQARFRVFASDGSEACSASFGPGEVAQVERVECVEHAPSFALEPAQPGLLIR